MVESRVPIEAAAFKQNSRPSNGGRREKHRGNGDKGNMVQADKDKTEEWQTVTSGGPRRVAAPRPGRVVGTSNDKVATTSWFAVLQDMETITGETETLKMEISEDTTEDPVPMTGITWDDDPKQKRFRDKRKRPIYSDLPRPDSPSPPRPEPKILVVSEPSLLGKVESTSIQSR